MTDFEQQLQSSFATVWPNADRAGCFFHFNQAVLRHTNKRLYEETITTPEGRQQMSDYKRHMRRACMLAFVPPEDVVDSWEQISAE